MNYSSSPFATHQPVLIELLKKTSGHILELGCGDGSTKLIRSHIDGFNGKRKLVSVESNQEWFNKYKHLETAHHHLYFVDAGNEDSHETGEKWVDFLQQKKIDELDFEICFIDQSPWNARTSALRYMLPRCKIVVVHDVDYFPVNNLWGKVINTKREGNKVMHKMDFSDVSANFKVFYPPFSHFGGKTGPPTLVCSNLMNDKEFSDLNISIDKYYD